MGRSPASDPAVRRVVHLLPHRGGGAEAYLDLLEALDGYRHERIPLSSSRSRWRGVPLVALRRAAVARAARAADIVHAHGDMAAILAAPFLRDRPSLITTHGLHRLRASTGVPAALVRRGLRRAVQAAGATICTSQAEAAELRMLLATEPSPRITVIPNGVPVPPPTGQEERARARAELGVRDGDLVALFVGRLEPRKEPVVAAEAAELAASPTAPLVLLVAGDGPLSGALASRASSVVRPLGFRRDTDRLHAAADVFVLPSRREGMSMALLEAMARGLAPIVSDAPGNAEAVGDAGRIVPVGDVQALAAGLAGLAREASVRVQLGAAARERVRQDLSAERFLIRTREAYETVLDGPR